MFIIVLTHSISRCRWRSHWGSHWSYHQQPNASCSKSHNLSWVVYGVYDHFYRLKSLNQIRWQVTQKKTTFFTHTCLNILLTIIDLNILLKNITQWDIYKLLNISIWRLFTYTQDKSTEVPQTKSTSSSSCCFDGIQLLSVCVRSIHCCSRWITSLVSKYFFCNRLSAKSTLILTFLWLK